MSIKAVLTELLARASMLKLSKQKSVSVVCLLSSLHRKFNPFCKVVSMSTWPRLRMKVSKNTLRKTLSKTFSLKKKVVMKATYHWISSHLKWKISQRYNKIKSLSNPSKRIYQWCSQALLLSSMYLEGVKFMAAAIPSSSLRISKLTTMKMM